MTVDGVTQTKLEGASLVYTFDQPKAPSRHRVQYFETNGNKAIYKDGWWAGDLLRSSWTESAVLAMSLRSCSQATRTRGSSITSNEDYSQSNNLAAKYPEKLAEMKRLFDSGGESKPGCIRSCR